jgi:4-aminobutyrate aminotransferase-like enzyme
MPSTLGSKIQTSDKINSLIEQLVQEVSSINSNIQTVAAAKPENADHSKKLIDQTGALRGRPLHYPYIGTGSGRGPYVEIEDGSFKLDLINGIGIHLMGHSHPQVMKAAVRGALSDVIMQGNLEPNNEYSKITEALIKYGSRKSRIKHAWLSTCGTMANENALKIARQKNSGRMVLAFSNAFAGRSTMMAEVTDNTAYKQGLPDYNEVLRVPFYDKNDPQSLEKSQQIMKDHIEKHKGQISVFVFEPMLGEGGYQAAPREFFIPLLEMCKANKIAVWADEVQTFCRTGEMFAFQTLDFGDYVDIATIAKTAQIGATLYTEDYNPKPGLIAGTFSGSTVSMTAGIEIMRILDEEGYLGKDGRIAKIHKRFIDGFNKLNTTTCVGKVQDAGGMGLMIALTPFDGKKEQVDLFLRKLFTNGVIAFPCGKGPVRARFLVPAIIKDEDIDLALNIIEKTILEGV